MKNFVIAIISFICLSVFNTAYAQNTCLNTNLKGKTYITYVDKKGDTINYVSKNLELKIEDRNVMWTLSTRDFKNITLNKSLMFDCFKNDTIQFISNDSNTSFALVSNKCGTLFEMNITKKGNFVTINEHDYNIYKEEYYKVVPTKTRNRFNTYRRNPSVNDYNTLDEYFDAVDEQLDYLIGEMEKLGR